MTTKKPNPNAEPADQCAVLKRGVGDAGEPISQSQAAMYLNNYMAAVKGTSADGQNYGFLYGIDQIQWLLGKIAAYNLGKTGDDRIQAIRTYFGCTIDPAREPVPAGQIVNTLFLIPVLGNGNDIPDLKIERDDAILGNPRPCPNECFMLSAFFQ